MVSLVLNFFLQILAYSEGAGLGFNNISVILWWFKKKGANFSYIYLCQVCRVEEWNGL